jgi:predicted Zn-ribbon and HTH transcriptional regulator
MVVSGFNSQTGTIGKISQSEKRDMETLETNKKFCDVCGVEITSENTSMMITGKCGNCKEIERGY